MFDLRALHGFMRYYCDLYLFGKIIMPKQHENAGATINDDDKFQVVLAFFAFGCEITGNEPVNWPNNSNKAPKYKPD